MRKIVRDLMNVFQQSRRSFHYRNYCSYIQSCDLNPDFVVRNLRQNVAVSSRSISRSYICDNRFNEDDQRFSIDVEYPLAIISAILATVLMMKLERKTVVEAAKPFNYDELKMNHLKVDKQVPPGNGGKPPSNRERFNFVADVVENVGKSVVCIITKDFQSVDLFTGSPVTISNGSGFLVSDDGLVVTNAHVIQGAERPSISVRLSDGRTYAAKVEYVDIQSDLATLRINSKGLIPLPLGRSCDTRIGEWVVCLGSPLGLVNTISAGVVSSVSRMASEIGVSNDIKYIQTDAAITFGNSGGPLVNLDGEVIGVCCMRIATGISLAIPIDHVKKFLEKSEFSKKSGKGVRSRRYAGISVLTLTEDIIEQLQQQLGRGQLSVKHGVIVYRVVIGSPAYFSGLRPGDIILSINGSEETLTAADVHRAISVEDCLHLIVWRNGEKMKITLTPEDILYD